jgi:hypothetical protein
MMTRRISCLGAVAIVTYLCAPSGCASSTDGTGTAPVNGSTGTSSTQGAGGSSSTTGSGSSGSSVDTTTAGAGGDGTATTTSGAGGSGTAGTASTGAAGGSSNDASCSSALAKTGAPCTTDCNIGCGFNAIGTKTCTCSGGFYSACPCPKPAAYMGAATAPYCPGDGMTAALKKMPCTKEWDECIGKDANTGTPAGCACLKDPTSNSLVWACGSTNKWFSLAM